MFTRMELARLTTEGFDPRSMAHWGPGVVAQEGVGPIAPEEVPPDLLDRWDAYKEGLGYLPPGGGPPGSPATLLEAIGFACGARIALAPPGCRPEFVREVVEAFAHVTEGWLLDRFSSHHTHFVMVHAKRPVLRTPEPYWSSVQELYYRAKALQASGLVRSD